MDQFAYLENRSVTQAILTVVETTKKSLIYGDKAAKQYHNWTSDLFNMYCCATVCKTVRSKLSVRCPSVLSVCPSCL